MPRQGIALKYMPNGHTVGHTTSQEQDSCRVYLQLAVGAAFGFGGVVARLHKTSYTLDLQHGRLGTNGAFITTPFGHIDRSADDRPCQLPGPSMPRRLMRCISVYFH